MHTPMSAGLTERTKFVAQLVTVATVEPDCWRALRYIDNISALTNSIPPKDAA